MATESLTTLTDPRWPLLGDSRADGQFVYAVVTTGVYCRPGCPSRCPNPDNVRFFSDHIQAESAGFRACKRCHPQYLDSNTLQTQLIINLCSFIERSEQEPSLTELAAYSGISRYHLQRLFKESTGLTPKAYAKAHRAKENEQYQATSRKKHTMTICYGFTECSLGIVLIAQSDRGICAVLFGDQPTLLLKDLQQRNPKAILIAGDQNFQKVIDEVVAVIKQPHLSLTLPLDIRGTLFQQQVWQALQQIPAGETRSYSAIAEAIGAPKAVRAVAGACAANAIAVIIPCHRVVRNDGNLSGYRWGAERKQKLLTQEAEHAKT